MKLDLLHREIVHTPEKSRKWGNHFHSDPPHDHTVMSTENHMWSLKFSAESTRLHGNKHKHSITDNKINLTKVHILRRYSLLHGGDFC